MKMTDFNDNIYSIKDVISIIRYRFLPGLAVGLLVSAVVAYWMMSKPPVYQASTSVMVEMSRDRILTNMEDIVDERRANNLRVALNTHFERLRSRQFAELVAKELNPGQVDQLVAPYLNPDYSDRKPNPVAILRTSFSISSRSDSQTLIFIGRHRNPQVASWLSTLYAETYIRHLTGLRAGSSEVAIQFLEEQVETAQREVEEGEQRLQDYRQDNNLVSIEENQEVVSQELQSLNEALNQHQISLVALRSQLDQIDGAENNPDALSRIPSLVENPAIDALISELENLKQERDILSRKYLERHPDMVANANRQEAALRQLDAAADRRRATIDETRIGILAQIEILRERIAEAEERARELDRLSIQYTVREREVISKRRTYERLIDRLNETQVTTQLDNNSLRIMDKANPPGRPLTPSLQKTVTTASLLVVLCLIAIPLGLELVDNRVRTFADVELVLKSKLLGDVKQFKSDNSVTRKSLEKNEEVVESFRSIYSTLLINGELPERLSLVVTSTIPSEGKSFVVGNLGEVFARHGRKTIVIDTDLRRPSLARFLDSSNHKGLLSWIRGRQEKQSKGDSASSLASEDLAPIYITENLDLLPAGGSTKAPTEVLTSNDLDQLISHLKERYDVIIFDTPPVGVFPDATLLADYVDASVFVIRQKKVARAAARQAINQLNQSNAPVAGVVLNGINSNPTSGRSDYGSYASGYKYAYSYRQKYKDYYNDQEDGK